MEGAVCTQQNGRCGIPAVVFFRQYISHAIILALSLLVYWLLFAFVAADVTEACAECKRVNDAPCSEIVFSGEPCGDESFYYLYQQFANSGGSSNLSCDLLMCMQGEEYSKNILYFDGELASGTCAVSANIANEYGLGIGKKLNIVATDASFTVAEIITAQAGVDDEYKNRGIVILSYEESLLKKSYEYVSFGTDGDEYRELKKLVYVEDLAEGKAQTIALGLFAYVAATAVLIAVSERFLFKNRRKDYALFAALGRSGGRILIIVLAENLLKYGVPLLAIMLGYIAELGCYGAMYALPMLGVFVMFLAEIAACSLIAVRRLYKWKK